MTVRPGAALKLGSHAIRLAPPGGPPRRPEGRGVHLVARDVGLDVGGKTLLDGVSLTIEPGQLVGLMGPSGAGKTTLLRTLNGYATPTRGEATLNGVDLARMLHERAPGLGVVFMSAYPAEVLVREGLHDLRVTFLAKPFTREDLLRIVGGAVRWSDAHAHGERREADHRGTL